MNETAHIKPLSEPPSEPLSAFEQDLLASVRQALAGDTSQALVHTAADIADLKRRGRPVGTTKSPATFRIDTEALNRWRSSGKGWQTRAAQVLAKHAPN